LGDPETCTIHLVAFRFLLHLTFSVSPRAVSFQLLWCGCFSERFKLSIFHKRMFFGAFVVSHLPCTFLFVFLLPLLLPFDLAPLLFLISGRQF